MEGYNEKGTTENRPIKRRQRGRYAEKGGGGTYERVNVCLDMRTMNGAAQEKNKQKRVPANSRTKGIKRKGFSNVKARRLFNCFPAWHRKTCCGNYGHGGEKTRLVVLKSIRG